ncbi:MFS transporter [Ammoniphilus sp. 3BR4]|uniref:MFS transporter n=1 Tax=Ammoniphilus sp. 3BR4 TaxID=3158265 RepID=UPI0034661DE1
MTLRTVLIITLSFHTMVSITRPLIALYASSLGANTFEIGLLTAAFAFFPLIFAIHAGKISDQMGDRIPILWGSIGCTVGLTLPFFSPTMSMLYASQIIVGMSHLVLAVSLQNVLGHVSTKETRDHYFNIFSMFVAMGAFIGPIIGGYLAEHLSYALAFLIAALLGIVPIAFSFFVPLIRVQKMKGEAALGSPLTLLKLPLLRKALASSALVLYSKDIFVAYFPLLGQHFGLTASEIGWIIAIQGLSMMAVRLFLGRLTHKYGRNLVLLGSILIAGISFILVPIVGHVYLFGLLSSIMGIGLGCGQPLSMTTTYNASPKTRTGEILGLRLASNRLSQLVAPLIFGVIGSWGGLLTVFYMSGLFLIGGAFLTRSNSKDDVIAS